MRAARSERRLSREQSARSTFRASGNSEDRDLARLGQLRERDRNVFQLLAARDADDEKHVHPLQLDVIDRAIVLWSNPGEIVLTPFMGVGSEVYGAVKNGRLGVGIELKESYYRQALKNVRTAVQEDHREALGQMEMI